MRVTFHAAVQPDLNRILHHYDQISKSLGDEFWSELNGIIESLAANPSRYHPAVGDLRRAKLKRFPYHVLFRVLPDRVRITAIRHHKQNPRTALRRR